MGLAYYYHNGAEPIYNGIDIAHALVLLLIVVVLGLAADFVFRRRDLRLG